MWKYQAINDWNTISLHDCRITQIREQNSHIIYTFADGYWIVDTNTQNPYKKYWEPMIILKSHCVTPAAKLF